MSTLHIPDRPRETAIMPFGSGATGKGKSLPLLLLENLALIGFLFNGVIFYLAT